MRPARSQPHDRIFLWNATTGKMVREIAADLGLGHVPLIFAPDGRTLAFADKTGTVRLWETGTGRPRRTFQFRTPPGHPDWGSYTLEDLVAALAFSSDGRLLALGCEHEVYLWDALTGEQVGHFSGHQGKIAALAFAPDGKALASAGDDTAILLWDLAALSGRRLVERKLEAHTLVALWAELGRDSAADAMARLFQAPSQAIALLEKNVRPVPVRQADKVAKHLDRLDSSRFRDREEAMLLLEGFAELVEPDLRKRLEGKLTEEVRRRIGQLLDRLRAESAEQMRLVRAVEVLEHIGTAGARAILRALAGGAAEARLTQEARASLKRLDDTGAVR